MRSDLRKFRTFDEIEAFWRAATGVSPNLTQLSKGSLNFEVRCYRFAGVTVTWVKSEGRQLWRDIVNDDCLHFGYMIESGGPVRSAGFEVGVADALVWQPGAEIDYLLEGPLSSVEFTISEDIVSMLGWEPTGSPLQRVSYSDLVNLTHKAKMACDWLSSAAHQNKPTIEISVKVWRYLILDGLAQILRPWLNNLETKASGLRHSRQHRTIRSAETLYALAEPESAPDADQIAADLGMSRRKLFYAFQETLGIGPRRYFELLRLHAFRRDLAISRRDENTITQLGLQNGFTQMGRLAGIYKDHFGEKPSDTLSRSN